jgi:DNA-binding transcriptional LysR family regulator
LLTDIGQEYLPDLSEAFRIISRATEAIAPALTGRKLKIGISEGLRSHLPQVWPVPSDALSAHVGKPVVATDLELVRAGDLDGLIQLRQVTAHGLSNEKIASILTPTVTEDIYYICPVGLAGCRQSRVLVSSLISTFSDVDKE